jgi:ankyrin repeat protein
MDVDPKLAKEFLSAVKKGEAARASELLSTTPTLLHFRNAEESTPLHHAAWKGHAEVATLLLDAGAELNAQSANTHYGGTPLHCAAHGNQSAIVKLLIERGADLHAQSCNGRTPLEETEFHKATTAANVLKRAGATAGSVSPKVG